MGSEGFGREVQIGVGGDGVGFRVVQVRGLGSGRSEELGDWGRIRC